MQVQPHGTLAFCNRQHDADGEAVGRHRRTAVAQKWRDHSGKRRQPQEPARDDRRLDHERERGGGREKRRVIPRRPGGHAKAAPAQDRVQRDDNDQACQSELLTDRRQHEVGVCGGDHLRLPETRPGTPECAGRQRPQSVGDLIASDDAVVPGIEPDRHALPHRRGKADLIRGGETGDEQYEAGNDERRPSTRDSVQRQEHAGQHERRTEILLEEEKSQQQRHAHEQRSNIFPSRQPEMPQPGS